jgi:4-amino-4-deoxy-L-arabinose transferase-like glycosyltransferase
MEKKNNLKTKLIIFLVAMTVAMSLFAYFYATSGAKFFNPFLQGTDQAEYGRVAVNLAEKGIFSLSKTAPYVPDPSRTPVYPLFLAFTFLLTKSFILATLITIILGALTAVIVFDIAMSLFGSRRLAIASGVIFAFLPYRIYISNLIMADTLFAFLFSLVILLFVKMMTKETEINGKNIAIFGVLLGITTLTRPVSQFLIFIFVAFLLMLKHLQLKRKIVLAGFLVLSFLLTLSPWMIRNYVHFDQAFLSSIGRYHLYVGYLTPWRAVRSGISRDQAYGEAMSYIGQKYGADAMFDVDKATQLGEEAKKEILSKPVDYALYHFSTIPISFLNNDVLATLREAFRIKLPEINMSQKILTGDFVGLSESFSTTGLSFVFLFIASYLFVLIKFVFGIAGIFLYSKENKYKNILTGLFLLCVVFYFPLLVGPEGHARFRIPIESILIIFSLYFIVALASWAKHQSNFISKRSK